MNRAEFGVDTEKNKIIEKTLYLVATPIGNLSDFSERGVKVLSEVDFIAAEDTRVTAKLLSAFGISKPLVIYHEHNKISSGEQIIKRLTEGQSGALVTDAGTPAVSDPGEDLVKRCIDNQINVTAVPGACAAIAALTLSGFDTRSFVFEGFISQTGKERRERLDKLSSERRTVILYESPHNIARFLSELYSVFGNRRVAVCRELTKLNEEIIRCGLEAASRIYEEKEARGEFVVVLEGASDEDCFWENMTVLEHVNFYTGMSLSKMDAIKAAARDRGVSKNSIYKELL